MLRLMVEVICDVDKCNVSTPARVVNLAAVQDLEARLRRVGWTVHHEAGKTWHFCPMHGGPECR